jgi:hypothetical protein
VLLKENSDVQPSLKRAVCTRSLWYAQTEK